MFYLGRNNNFWQYGNSGLILSQSSESYQKDANLDFEINAQHMASGQIQFKFLKFVVEGSGYFRRDIFFSI